MRFLRAEALRSLCGAPLQEIECLYLDSVGLERIDSGLSECQRLRYLNLSNNALRTLCTTELGACRDLWSICVNNNQLIDVSGLSRYALLGSVDLSNNRLNRRTLSSFRRTHILCLCVKGNPELSTLSRAQLINQLPLVWVLNGEFITAAERLSLLNDNAESSTDGIDRQIQLPAVTTALTASASAKALLQLPPWWGQSNTNAHATQLAQFLCHEIPDISKAEGSRLKHLLTHYEAIAREQNAFTLKQSYSLAATAASTTHKEQYPLPYTQQILSLSPAAMLDVAVMLTVKLRYSSSIPVRVLKEALLIRLVTEVGSKAADDIAVVPPYICTALIWLIKQHLNELLQQQQDTGLSYDIAPPVLAYSELELLHSMPSVVTGIDTDAVHDDQCWQLLCRHTVILLSRSPNCPPLIAKHASPLLQKQYELMKPLLLKAGMSHSDLSVSWETATTTVAGLRWNKQEPTRNYPKLWNGDIDTTRYQQQSKHATEQQNTTDVNEFYKAVRMPHAHDLHTELSSYELGDSMQFSSNDDNVHYTNDDTDNMRLGMYSRNSNRSEQQQQYTLQHDTSSSDAEHVLYTDTNQQQQYAVATVMPNMCDNQWVIHGRRRVCIGDTCEVLHNVFTIVIAVDDHDDTVTVQKFKHMHKPPFLSSCILHRSDMLWESRNGGLWLHTQAAKQMQLHASTTAATAAVGAVTGGAVSDDMHATAYTGTACSPVAVMVDSIDHQFIIASPKRHSSNGVNKDEHWQSIETCAAPITVVAAPSQVSRTRPSTSAGITTATNVNKHCVSSNALGQPQRPLQRR
jgi:hypothetical protein